MDTDKIIRRYESRISMSVLAEFIMLGMDSTGSFALADSKTTLFATSLRTILESIASTFNNTAVRRLFEMNPEFPEHCYPEITYGDIETQDLKAMGAYLQSLSAAGLITPDPQLEDTLREMASLPVTAAAGAPLHSGDQSLYGSNAAPGSDILSVTLRQVEAGQMTQSDALNVLQSAMPDLSESQLRTLLDFEESGAVSG
jgi:phage gp29-like protein